MKLDLKSLNWSNIVAALFALGIITTTDPTAAATGLAAMLIVWMVNYIIQTFDWKPRRAWLTNGLYVIAVILAIVFQPTGAFPKLPIWNGDLAQFSEAFVSFLRACSPVISAVMASAFIFYNNLQPLVLSKLPDLPALLGNKKAQGVAEYALILVLVAVVVIAALSLMGPLVSNVFSTINESL